MCRTAFVLVLLVAALGIVAAGCGGEENQSAAPETVQGEVTTTETTSTETETTTSETTTSSESTTTETSGAPPTGDPVAGKAIFTGASGCTGCHTLADAGSSGTVGPNLDDAMPDAALVMDRVTHGRGVMPPFAGTLTEQQIADVAAYVSSVAGK
jgi:mono/diheme cytochrome c family protein